MWLQESWSDIARLVVPVPQDMKFDDKKIIIIFFVMVVMVVTKYLPVSVVIAQCE